MPPPHGTAAAVYGLLEVLAVPKGEWLLQTAAGSVLGRQLIQVGSADSHPTMQSGERWAASSSRWVAARGICRFKGGGRTRGQLARSRARVEGVGLNPKIPTPYPRLLVHDQLIPVGVSEFSQGGAQGAGAVGGVSNSPRGSCQTDFPPRVTLSLDVFGGTWAIGDSRGLPVSSNTNCYFF